MKSENSAVKHNPSVEWWAIFLVFSQVLCERAIFQTFWRLHCCPDSLFFEIETSNFGSRYVFLSPLKWQVRILPNLTFWIQNWLISGKIKVQTIIPKSLFLELETSNFGSRHVFWRPLKWCRQILPKLMFRIQKWHI